MIHVHTFKISDPLISTFEEFRIQQEFRNDKLSHNYSCSNFNFLQFLEGRNGQSVLTVSSIERGRLIDKLT